MGKVTLLYHRQLILHSRCVHDERFSSFFHRLHVRVNLPNRRRFTNDETFSLVLHRY